MHIFKKDIGATVDFLGFDSRTYRAVVQDYKKGCAKLVYNVRNNAGELYQVTAYIDRKNHDRISECA